MRFLQFWSIIAIGVTPGSAYVYPLDGYEYTGIRRLEANRLMTEGVIDGRKQPEGARLSLADVGLRLTGQQQLALPSLDAELTAQIEYLLGADFDSYGIAVLDLSDPDNPRYAEVNGDYRQNVGSVGKIIGALGLFQALADTWPREADRVRVLRQTMVTADEFSQKDTHGVPFYNVEDGSIEHRIIRQGDQASLWEYLDWMLSPSSNAAAGMVMREAMLIREFGRSYPLSEEEIRRFLDETPKSELTRLYAATFDAALQRHGFDLGRIRQGSIFTRGGKNAVTGTGTSYATANDLLKIGLLMEKGQLVDEFSSRELKRLLYVTERRIRYASAPALNGAAVYFKSGSLYSCKPEEGFRCGKYKGNRKNYMNSFAIVESAAAERELHYMVMLISNVLRKNSAVDHQTLGTRIQRLMEAAHAGAE